jgi:hypothetical protein
MAIFWLAICAAEFLFLKIFTTFISSVKHPVEPSAGCLNSVIRGFCISAGVICALVAITAIVAPPSLWDAMDYHLPRVIMWMNNHSVRFYATPDYTQLIYGPWAEYAMMHTYMLWGSDRFVNMIQFFSMVGSLIGVSLIAKSLGATGWGQVLSAVICVTIPEGVLEASGSANTYVLALWMTAAIAFLMNWNEDPSWFNFVCAGLSTALAIFTKGTAYVFLPFLILACWCMGSPPSRIKFLNRTALFLLLILAINGPHYLRCYRLTGSPLGLPLPDGGARVHLTVDHVTLKGTFANAVRNLSLQLGTPSARVNLRIEKAFRWTIEKIGSDPDDPKMIWRDGGLFRINHFSLSEIHASNPLHLFLLLVAIASVVWKYREATERRALCYALGVVAAFFSFSALVLWQFWSSRYELPLFVVGSALTGFVLERQFSRRVGIAIGLLLIASALPFVIANRQRSLVRWSLVDDIYHPRSVLYFTDTHETVAPLYIAAADAVNKLDCGDIGMDSYVSPVDAGHDPRSFFVYPLLAMIHADGINRRVWYSGVHNLTSRYLDAESHGTPCAVVCLDCARVPSKWAEYKRVGWRASVFDYIVVFSAPGSNPNGSKD